MIVSSLIFGFVHVTPSIMNGQVVTGLDMAQAALKTLQAGILGAFLAALFLKTRNIWGIALVHGLNDLFVMLGDALFSGTTSTTYVNNDAMMASASVVMYGVFFLLYIPIIVSTVRMLKQVETPCKGPFADRWS